MYDIIAYLKFPNQFFISKHAALEGSRLYRQ